MCDVWQVMWPEAGGDLCFWGSNWRGAGGGGSRCTVSGGVKEERDKFEELLVRV